MERFFAIATILLAYACAAYGAIDLTGCAPNGPKVTYVFFNSKGDIKSPGYDDGKYPDQLQCIYSIRAPFGNRIKLTFEELDIDPFDLCMKDQLAIHEGDDIRGPVHGIFCGDEEPNAIQSLGNSLTLVFRSDFLTGRKGFHIRYEVGMLPSICPLGYGICRNRNCFSPNDRCNGVDECGDGSDEEQCSHPAQQTTCGTTPITPYETESFDRIIGGREAKPGSWPWQVDLQLSFFEPNGHMCGGTLINANWVLSAGHCFGSNGRATDWRFHFGNHRKFNKDDNEQVRYAKRIIVYPGYTGDDELMQGRVDLTNDVALVQLNAPVKFTDYVRPACLPIQNQDIAVGTTCMATGWGMTRGTGLNDVLKQVDLSILDGSRCINDMIPYSAKTMICVKNAKGFQDVCHGDSGGPLACKISNVWYVMGATSYGTFTNFMGGLCALPQAHTVYARVSDKIQWISSTMQRYS